MPLPSAGDFVNRLADEFRPLADAQRAEAASAYMRHLFPFVGIPSPLRRQCVRAAVASVHPSNLLTVCETLYRRKEREYHYAAWDVACLPAWRRQLDRHDVPWLATFITRNAWWDTVDYLVPKVIGPILRSNRETLTLITNSWIADDNIWLQRAAIIVQLGWKTDTDQELLFTHILHRADSKEFFVQKGAGWALREYSKTNPTAVRRFLDANPQLSKLTRREGGKYC